MHSNVTDYRLLDLEVNLGLRSAFNLVVHACVVKMTQIVHARRKEEPLSTCVGFGCRWVRWQWRCMFSSDRYTRERSYIWCKIILVMPLIAIITIVLAWGRTAIYYHIFPLMLVINWYCLEFVRDALDHGMGNEFTLNVPNSKVYRTISHRFLFVKKHHFLALAISSDVIFFYRYLQYYNVLMINLIK